MDGYREYKRREFCNDVNCPRQLKLNSYEQGSAQYEDIRSKCKAECLCTTYQFHHWLIDKGFSIIKGVKE